MLLFGAVVVASLLHAIDDPIARVLTIPQETLDDSGRELKRWLLGQLVSLLIIGILTWAGLRFIGLSSAPSALALG